MCVRICLVILAVGWLIGWVERGIAGANEALDSEQVLHAAHLEVHGAALLEFFRLRTRPNDDPARIASLIRQLTATPFAVRQKAVGELIALGPLAMSALRKAVHDPDEAVVAAEARHCLHSIEQSPQLVQAAARLIAQCRPSGATEVLLDYLPFADNVRVSEEVQEALLALAVDAGKPDPTLLRALTDESSLRRAVAAEVLCQAFPDPEVQARVRPLLQDPRPGVRLRVALALAPLQDQDAIGTLIDLLGELPLELGKKARACLISLAGPQPPSAPLTADARTRKQCQAAWTAWWRGNDGTALLQEFRQRSLSEASRSKIKVLTRRLGDDVYAVREKSLKGLIPFGPPIIPLLRPLLRDPDPEIACRIRQCLELVKKDTTASTLLPPLAQLVAIRKPEGAAAALLEYLPFTEDEIIRESV